MVLNTVVGSAWQHLGNLRPVIAVLLMCLQEQGFLFWTPWLLLDIGGQVIVVPLSALLALPTGKCLSQPCPASWAIFLHVHPDDFIFLGSPRPLCHTGRGLSTRSVLMLGHSPAVKRVSGGQVAHGRSGGYWREISLRVLLM